MAESELASFTERLMRTSEVQKLALEKAYSYPIPLKNRHVAVFVYQMVGLPPADPKISIPDRYIEAIYPTAEIVEFRTLNRHEFAMPDSKDGILGLVTIPPEYLQAGAEDYFRRQKQFDEVYSRCLSAYFAGDPIDASTANQVLTELPVFGKKPLMPVLRAASPDFFSWLEKNAKP